ncbi:MAG TPA: metallophosphoesterase family protein [Gemmatimonadales bacterium]|nr:metallophosphoesterase family protein [Gemmatimonadales bacterium]
MRLGIISDTHGKVRAAVHEVFRETDAILHAGDVGIEAVLDELQLLAPVTAVYGNTDGAALRARLPRVAEVVFDGFRFVVTHGDQFGSPDPEALKAAYPEADVVIFGHTHRAVIRDFPDFTVALNPGAAGAARFGQPATVAIMETEPGIPPRARIVKLE